MPTPARTSVDQIVAAGRSILDADGLDGLTMQRVAVAVGVRAPSLYKRVQGRGDLVRLIANAVAGELAVVLEAAAANGDPRRDLRAIADAFRAWALAHPERYHLLFDRLPEGERVDPEMNARSSAVLLRTAAELARGRSMPWRPPEPSWRGPTASSAWSWPAPSDWAVTSTGHSSTALSG